LKTVTKCEAAPHRKKTEPAASPQVTQQAPFTAKSELALAEAFKTSKHYNT
jgi:hypothetical protein